MDAFDLVERKALADRVASGPQLTGSPKLRSFFLYVIDCAIREHPEEATEQQIGIHVFGRQPGYSSGDDSIVRSQARLLRLKLTAYFATEGADETLIIEIPKGHYLPVFRERTHEDHHAPTESHEHTENGSAEELASHSNIPGLPEEVFAVASPIHTISRFRVSPLRGVLLLLLFLILGLGLGAWGHQRWATSMGRSPDPLWSPFLKSSRSTLVIYSNPLFSGNPVTGLHLVGPDAPTPDPELADDTYTGTGEAAAIYQLSRFFYDRNADFVLKRSRLITWDEARLSNLIFIGASSQNTALHDLPTLSEFSIALDERDRGYIVNQHPRPGEPARFPVQDRTQETAILAFLPGLEPGTHILIFSGLTTIGTQAAVEYACRPENIAALTKQAGLTKRDLRSFEAVLRVGISKGVGVNTQLLLLHNR
ncbi:hypothetical protein [Granulicella sp. dw_53]|uniref:hypothetical protein n=1 Tax=Granulicella sp. dw_53 TaxID=2719792 RepID=UPI001BD2652D|nr:hypothetical protein [Granulicella sp. dw_53]